MFKKLEKASGKAKFFVRLLKAKLLNQPRPLLVLFNVTNRCNLRCRYCFGKYYERNDAELTTQQVFSLIDQLAAAGTLRIGIGGGEPLLRPDIEDVICYIKSKNIECGLNTNGILLPQRVSLLKHLDSICISLDGRGDVHDANRGDGSFKKACEALELSAGNGVETHVSSVLTKKTIDSVPFLLKEAKRLGFRVQFSPLYAPFYGKITEAIDERLTENEYKEAIKYILKLKKQGEPIFYSEKTYTNLLEWSSVLGDRYMGSLPDFQHVPCSAGRYFCHVEATGDVYPCAYSTGYKALNFLESGFGRAFAHANTHSCRACRWACYNEFNLLFSLDPNVLKNLVLNTLKFKEKQKDNSI